MQTPAGFLLQDLEEAMHFVGARVVGEIDNRHGHRPMSNCVVRHMHEIVPPGAFGIQQLQEHASIELEWKARQHQRGCTGIEHAFPCFKRASGGSSAQML